MWAHFCPIHKKSPASIETGLPKQWACRVCRLTQAVTPDALDVLRAEALRGPFDLELNLLAIPETFVPGKTAHVVAMDEDVLATIAGLDESEALLTAKPLYSSALHRICFVVMSLTVFYQPEECYAFPIRYHHLR